MAAQGERVYEIIRQRIIDQVYVPSQTLVESTLAEELGVSRNTVKKALMQLVNEKLVDIKANKSAIVKSLSIDEAVHLLEIRERLEGLIAYCAAQVITDKEIDIIRASLAEMKEYIKDSKFKEYSATNDLIHHVIYEACPNKEAVEMIESIRLQLRRYNKRTILISGRSIDSYNEHEVIFKALEARNPEMAEIAMRKHVSNVRNVLKENYSVLF
ncbi:GntR family transcriptional regulator [Youngiibacter multivorans]|uniref:DNA-binding GntR family transcriptional regulator n=1 Tax=Youngiibacter multivorans TaxID=937251 RepID=A0ABS4G0P1_9CLOT|nr:GntR family transcriptional regulator [Youngiibacter multivorans]MBP1917900.1 DNA-binding GntR family transcriptional regulator [Youngiibacter multivorans]